MLLILSSLETPLLKMKPIPLIQCMALLLILSTAVTGCRPPVPAAVQAGTPPAVSLPTNTSQTIEGSTVTEPADYLDPQQPVEKRVEDLLERMTLEEKIGQMTQVEKDTIPPPDIARYLIGSVLSGGGGSPDPNTVGSWAAMVDGFQTFAIQTRLGVPLIYGADGVHGHSNVWGATIYPHNIGLGATRDPALVEAIGRATAEEMAATGVRWNFAPVVAVPQDIRWGRTYEGYSEDTGLVTLLGTAYLQGLQNPDGEINLEHPLAVLATPKHFIGDGGTAWGSSQTDSYQLDQGDMLFDEAGIREKFLPPYQAAIESGAHSIMVSFNSWQGTKLHAHRYLLSEMLKSELGFTGFLISDFKAIDQIPGDYYSDVVTSINAGLDMIMVPYDYRTFISTLTMAVEKGDVTMDRIDDAVGRILRVKFAMGLFERPFSNPASLSLVGSPEHRSLARRAVAKSLVLLKNAGSTLPLSKETPLIFVAGGAANDIGKQCGGWTITWQGQPGNITPGTSIVQAIRAAVADGTRVEYSQGGAFDQVTGENSQPAIAHVGIVVVGENPYAEGPGDRAELSLPAGDRELIQRMRARSQKLVVILISGRPLVITGELSQADAWVAAWLPGTEGHGISDVLFGDLPFTGKLPYTWPRAHDQLPLGAGEGAPLFPYGYGLET